MTHSVVLLNDGSSAVLLNDGSSQVLLNVAGKKNVGAGGGVYPRIKSKYRRQPPQEQMVIKQFDMLFTGKPTLIMTNTTSLKAIPLIKQYVMRLFDIKLKPITSTNQIISEVTINPVKEKDVHIANINCKLKQPLAFEGHSELPVVLRVKVDDYFTTDLKGKSMNGINMIRRAMSLNEVRTFEFRESSQNWESADTLSDLDKRIKVLDDRIDTLQREVDPREKVFEHPSSFVGQVTYTPENNSMQINLNGQIYGFCGVPERIFAAFEGASSKGGYFARNIRGQFNC